MRTQTETDLNDACDAIEHVLKRLPKLTLEERIDVGARIRGAAKNIETMDKLIKDEIKATLKNKPGTLKGETWKASLSLVSTERLDQKMVKENHPDVYAACLGVSDVSRVTFEPR